MKFELDNFQKQAIKSLLDGLNVLVTAPTGSGKTLIAEKGIEKYIEDGKKVIYTTPIKALSNQKFNDFQNEGIDTGLLTGDRNENPNANLIIATTEILRNMIFSEDERINEIGLVILDEVHYLADKERGATWEEIIIHLPKKIKILGLSATIGNENEFLSWIVSQRGPTDLIKSNIRPVPLEISLVTATQNDDQITTIKSTKDKKNKRIFQFDKKYRKFKKPTLSNQLEFISLKNSTPSIFFFFSRDKVESKARHASNLIGKTTDNHDLKVLFDSVFGDLTIEEFNLLNLDEQLLSSQENTLDKWYNIYSEKVKNTSEVDEALLDDINTPGYIAKLHDLYNAASKGDEEKKSKFNKACKLIGLFDLSKEEWESLKKSKISVSESYIENKIEERIKAKNIGNFALADKIREELSSKGITIEDQKGKTIWKVK